MLVNSVKSRSHSSEDVFTLVFYHTMKPVHDNAGEDQTTIGPNQLLSWLPQLMDDVS